jgi:hypothetical protein
MLDSHSVCRSTLETGVTSANSFRWRHSFFCLSKDERPDRLGRIAEADEIYVTESHKRSSTWPHESAAVKRGISNEHMCMLRREGQTTVPDQDAQKQARGRGLPG